MRACADGSGSAVSGFVSHFLCSGDPRLTIGTGSRREPMTISGTPATVSTLRSSSVMLSV